MVLDGFESLESFEKDTRRGLDNRMNAFTRISNTKKYSEAICKHLSQPAYLGHNLK